MRNDRRTSVAFIPGETAGFLTALASGFAKVGWTSEVFLGSDHPFDYESQFLSGRRWLLLLRSLRRSVNKSRGMKKFFLRLLGYTLGTVGVLDIAFRFRVVVVNNGRSFLPLSLDLVIFRAAGCAVISCHCHGSASRSPWSNCLNRYPSLDQARIMRDARRIRREVSISTRVSSHVLGSETLRELISHQNWCIEELGFPVQLPAVSSFVGRRDLRPLVVHVPSDPAVKGTEEIRRIVSRLQKEFSFDYREYTTIKRAEVVSIFSRATVVIDQLYSDRRFSVTAAECALLGTPCLIYGLADFRGKLDSGIADVAGPLKRPDHLETDLRRVLRQPELSLERAQELRTVAADYFDPERIARSLLSSFEKPPTVDFGKAEVYRLGSGSSVGALLTASQLRSGIEPLAAEEMFSQLRVNEG